MVTGTRSFTLEDTFLEPQVLDPPPTRHALFVFLLALAVVLHLATAGWGDLHNGLEGQFAGGAREMLSTQQWLVPTNNAVPQLETPPLVYWVIILSYQIFGVTATAARLPIALAMIASIALTFLIGERLAGYWRGFAAGLIHLCFCGVSLLGGFITPEPVLAALIAGAIFCAICGFQRRRFRHWWFTGVWVCISFACLAKGLEAVLYLGAICLLLALFFREARLRFRLLLHWPYLLLFVLVVAPWFIWAQNHFPGFLPRALGWSSDEGMPRWQFLTIHAVWWFPASILVLPGLLVAARRTIRPHEITFADAVPLCWMAVGFLPLLLMGGGSPGSSMSMWSAFALYAAVTWERTPRTLQVAALCLIALGGAVMGAIGFLRPDILGSIALPDIPTGNRLVLLPLLKIAGSALLVFAALAAYSAARQRADIALAVVLASMIPIGLCLAEGMARMAPLFSLAEAARFLNPRLGQTGQVLYEGSLQSGSSLTFYLDQKFFLVNQPPDFFDQSPGARAKYLDEPFVLEAWTRADPLYLIIRQDRVPHWRRQVIERVHIYHQVTTCGPYVVLSNQL